MNSVSGFVGAVTKNLVTTLAGQILIVAAVGFALYYVEKRKATTKLKPPVQTREMLLERNVTDPAVYFDY